ncbi:MAG: hypothetical protein AAF387_20205 [Pseudomonadota bacterium]
MDFTIDINAGSGHFLGTQGIFNVGMQVKIFGSDIDDSSVTLTNTTGGFNESPRPFDAKFTLFQGDSGSSMGGQEAQYLYLWQIESDLPNGMIAPWFDYEFNFNASATSLSLAEIAIDIGRASGDLPDPPPPEPEMMVTVPIVPPALALLLPFAVGALGVRRSTD